MIRERQSNRKRGNQGGRGGRRKFTVDKSSSESYVCGRKSLEQRGGGGGKVNTRTATLVGKVKESFSPNVRKKR